MRILSLSRPGGDRGPAVGYFHHVKALSEDGFSIQELTKEIWHDNSLFKTFDLAWAYVRFHPAILERCVSLGIPVLGGPNVVLERADLGITDDWERWYLEQSKVSLNVNVADYYTQHVKKFSKNSCMFKTLEYCYESEVDENLFSQKNIDVTVYVKDRINDSSASKIAEQYCRLLNERGLTYRVLTYGTYDRKDYINSCNRTKVTAWFSIEDYCSLAQIESHRAGSTVVGTPYNLTIPTDESVICHLSQEMTSNWISWKDKESVARDYLNATLRCLSDADMTSKTLEVCKLKHSYAYYRAQVKNILKDL